MNEESRGFKIDNMDPSETDLVSLLRKMQQQLNFLEKKIDLLISQSQPKSFGKRPERPFEKRNFSKPPRSFDRSRPQGRNEGESSSRDREAVPRRFYEGFTPGKKRGTNPGKKPHFPRRRDRE